MEDFLKIRSLIEKYLPMYFLSHCLRKQELFYACLPSRFNFINRKEKKKKDITLGKNRILKILIF